MAVPSLPPWAFRRSTWTGAFPVTFSQPDLLCFTGRSPVPGPPTPERLHRSKDFPVCLSCRSFAQRPCLSPSPSPKWVFMTLLSLPSCQF